MECRCSAECRRFAATMARCDSPKRKWATRMKCFASTKKIPDFLEFLEQLHLRPAARLRVHQREYDETMAVTVAGRGAGRVHLANPPPNASGFAARLDPPTHFFAATFLLRRFQFNRFGVRRVECK